MLGRAGLLKYQPFTCLPNTRSEFSAEFEGATYTGSRVQADDALITAQGTAFAEFTQAVIQRLGLWKDTRDSERAYAFIRGEA